MYRTTSVMALGLFLGLAPVGALAQTTTDQTQTQQQLTTEPTAPETQQQTTEPTAPETQQQLTEPAAPETDAPAMDVIAEQDEDAMLASTIIGSSVMLADESIGTVSDLIIDADERLQGVLVGVGGFLGIGEKRVALPMDRITIRRPEPGQVELTADITREELEEKEAFRTASQIRAEREAEQAEQMQQQPLQPPQ
jgi:sporulation protein YlmC with PRC-barrel domain